MITRKKVAMPVWVRALLKEEGVFDAYCARPAYQRNDYLGWMARAKRVQTKQKRAAQMVRELRNGGVYMGMRHNPSKKA